MEKEKKHKFNGAPLVAIYEELGADKKLAGVAIGGDARSTKKETWKLQALYDMKGFQLGHGDHGTAVSGLTAKEIKEKTQKEKSNLKR
jgi:hypothetical protein